MSEEMDTFRQRLEKACKRAGVEFSPTPIAKLVDGVKQTAHTWLDPDKESLPRYDLLYKLADALKVDARWLATGQGDMLPKVVMEPDRTFTEEALGVAREFDALQEPARSHLMLQLKFLRAAQEPSSGSGALHFETTRVRRRTAAVRSGQKGNKKQKLAKRDKL